MGMAVGLVVFAFIVFAFIKGDKVKPSGRNPDDWSTTMLGGGGGGS